MIPPFQSPSWRMIVVSSLAVLTLLVYCLLPYQPVLRNITGQLSESAIEDGTEKLYPVMSPAIHLNMTGPPLKGHHVISSTRGEDIRWAKKLNLPGLEVIQYVADDPEAQYHPPANKGHEAIMMLQYMVDFYDSLPDYVVFTHAQEHAWHVEAMFEGSTAVAMRLLDTQEVMRRGYVNLRVSWENGCPAWIDTTKKRPDGSKTEEMYMKDAFAENFPDVEVPRIMAGPCCNQFAVTREKILAVPREQYQRHVQWLVDTELPDDISGRTWEHMFYYLFLNKTVDCPVEWKTYCRAFHICFDSKQAYEKYVALGNRASMLESALTKGSLADVPGLTDSMSKERAKKRAELMEILEDVNSERALMKKSAVLGGQSLEYRMRVTGDDLYVD